MREDAYADSQPLPVLDVRPWPASANRWQSLTASALRDAGMDGDEVADWVFRSSGARTVVDVMDLCLEVLREYYEVKT